MALVEQLEALLVQGQDNALIRFGLGKAYLNNRKLNQAIAHLRAAVSFDPGYSAAWKLLGQALTEAGQVEEAAGAYEEGIRVAEAKGDVQAAKAMRVFLNRLQR